MDLYCISILKCIHTMLYVYPYVNITHTLFSKNILVRYVLKQYTEFYITLVFPKDSTAAYFITTLIKENNH